MKIFREFPNSTDDELHAALVKAGIESEVASQLLEFIPMAYTRLMLAPKGARFSNFVRVILPDGRIADRLLSEDPIWGAIVRFAEAEADSGIRGADILAVAGRSAEFDAANRLLQQGSKLENLSFDPPLIRRVGF